MEKKNPVEYWLDSFRGLSKDVWLLSLITLINRSGAVVVLFLSLYLTEQLGFGKEQAGILIGFFGAGALLGNLAGGYLTDRFGYYWVMFASLFSVGFLYFAMMGVRDYWPLCALAMATGLVGDIYNPASSASVAAYSEPENHSRTLSLLRMAINLGFAIGSAAVGFVAGSWGYDWLFVIDGCTCLLASFAFLFLMENKPDKGETTESADPAPPVLRSAYRDGWYLLFLLGLALCSLPFFQLFTAYPVFLKESLLFTEHQFGAIMAFNGLLLFFFEMPIVHALGRKKLEYPSLVIGALLIGLSFLVFSLLGHTAAVAVFAMVLIAFGEILNFPFSTAVALGRSQVGNRGQYMGLFSMTFAVIFIFAPWLGMKVAAIYGYGPLWFSMGVSASLGGLLLYALGRRRERGWSKIRVGVG